MHSGNELLLVHSGFRTSGDACAVHVGLARRSSPMHIKKPAIILAHALVGWALCAATMGIGMAVTSQANALVIHAVAAPIFFAALSWHYFTRFHYTSPLRTAVIFTAFVIVVDFFVVALAILH